MDVATITTRLYAIATAILEKTGEKPWIAPYLNVSDGKCSISLYQAMKTSSSPLGIAKGKTPEAALDDADRIVAKLPDLDAAKLHRHMARVADCIDKAHADGIADEFVDPLRVTVKVMSENLLAAPRT